MFLSHNKLLTMLRVYCVERFSNAAAKRDSSKASLPKSIHSWRHHWIQGVLARISCDLCGLFWLESFVTGSWSNGQGGYSETLSAKFGAPMSLAACWAFHGADNGGT